MNQDDESGLSWATTGLLLVTVLAGMLVSFGLRSGMSDFFGAPDQEMVMAVSHGK